MNWFTRSREAAKKTGLRGDAETRRRNAAPVAHQRVSHPRGQQVKAPLAQAPSPRARPLRVFASPREPLSSYLRAFAPSRESILLTATLVLTACATQISSAIQHAPATPGFLLGVWHGFIFPVAWVLSLIMPDVAVYAVPNTGGWYDFGYFIGVMFLGVGARQSRTVYVSRRSRA